MKNRIIEVAQRIGSRPALIHMASAGNYFGDPAPYDLDEASGIATIDIFGALSNSKWSWGGTTYGGIQDQMKYAASDPKTRGVILNINSPGGETDNAFETADTVAALAKVKPVFAVAATTAFSAAYLIASQADSIYCTPTSGAVGSVGVWCGHMDYSEMLAKDGISVTLFSAGSGKTDGNPYEPLSESAKVSIQGEIDRLYGAFVGSVASGRGISAEDIRAMGAKLMEGAPAALASKLADKSGDIDTAFDDMFAGLISGSLRKSSAASAAGKTRGQMDNVNQNGSSAADAAALERARKDGAEAAAEIADICAIAGAPSSRVVEFIAAGKSPKDVRAVMISERAAADAKSAINPAVNPGGGGGTEQASKARPWREVLSALGAKLKPEGSVR